VSNPICVLAGSRTQYEEYVLSQGSKLGIHNKDYVDGTSSTCLGIHFSAIVEVGTFGSHPKDAELRLVREASVWPGCKCDQWVIYKHLDGRDWAKCTNCGRAWDVGVGKLKEHMKNGEIRKLPQANSPMWNTQWAYQGTAKAPYIVSAKKKPGNGMTSGWDQTWGCSCPDWTRHSSRVDCKHILAVKLKEKIATNPVQIMGANMSPEVKKDFEQFLARKQKIAGLKSQLDDKGRRFRTE
jgi:SWIM zinc finger